MDWPIYKTDTKRSILVVGLVFSIVLVLQPLFLPYRDIISSTLSFDSVVLSDHSTLINGSNSIASSVVLGAIEEIKSESKNQGNDSQEVEDHNSVGKVHISENEDTSFNTSRTETGFSPHPITLSLQTDMVNLTEDSTRIRGLVKRRKGVPQSTSISDMEGLLRQSRVSSMSLRPRWFSVRDEELLFVKSQIERAPIINSDPDLYSILYRNISMFRRSYELMEKTFKVYVYTEGDQPVFHQPQLKGIYASEGWFMKLMEGNKQFVVKDPSQAHMFYLPFSAHQLRRALYVNSKKHKSLSLFIKNYVDLIAGKYNFWNRTGGADHFLAACHDWAPHETMRYMGTCIRALCNANVARSFTIGKDVSLPVTMVRFPDEPLRSLGGKPPLRRPFLAFFAGSMHGYLRPVLLENWENDPDMKIFGPLPRDSKPNYLQYLKSSKYCICARGYEVHTPRVIEAIFHECVPVIISDNYVPPFFEILNWGAFALFVPENDVPNLKNILVSIPRKKYLEMQMRVKKVQKHFLWHKNPVKYDIFYMTLHSIWYNRVFQMRA
ncbi:hypothetical protein ACHQM5_023224 [Ranunculus cassubicifolius]